MTDKMLALYDNRPFFERALQYGVKHRIIDRKKIDEILESGPRGMIQIAHTFGTEYLHPDILEARNRIVNLVGLSLENASEWDLEKAAKLLADNAFLSHSKGGSEMVKFIHHLPDTSILETYADPQPLVDSYDRYAPGKKTASWLLSKYREERYRRMRNENVIRACEWFMGKFPRFQKDTIAWHDAEWVLATLLLSSIEGFHLETLPSRQEILVSIRRNRWKTVQWNEILEGTPLIYIPYMRKIITIIEKTLEQTSIKDSDIQSFESIERYTDDIDEHSIQISNRWKNFTKGKSLTRQEKQTLLFSFLAGYEPKTSITQQEAKKMIGYLSEHAPEYEKAIDVFMENNIPYEYHENMKKQWLYLAKEMDTLYGKDVPMSTKIWILEETGCNILKPKKDSKKSDK